MQIDKEHRMMQSNLVPQIWSQAIELIEQSSSGSHFQNNLEIDAMFGFTVMTQYNKGEGLPLHKLQSGDLDPVAGHVEVF